VGWSLRPRITELAKLTVRFILNRMAR